MKIGIIGFGQMGKFLARHFKEKHEVFVTDKIDKTKEAEKIGIKFIDIDEIGSKDLVILAVPISAFEDTLKLIRNYLKEGSIVLDICSVKSIPCKLMQEKLPHDTDIIGTHPLFGPQSGRHGISGLKIVICPLRAKKESRDIVTNLLKELELDIIETTPEEHDKAMAISHALMHFIAKGMINVGIKNQEIKISALDRAIELIEIFKEDSEQLFKDIQNFNPFAKEIRNQFLKELGNINKELDK
ncbi:MAG: prephenate dehydrogenase/arogenate dehydrogenase family protein [Candidatus Aenigmarchaeota archaeon]|nr:prephenate dehydrogenase/arogenate dehydrogenase family protein [Candidatus Aenigmarchaeota archaeon]